jgi:solute carrier family 6 amino acid transporter-like protein 5/7/9/14
MFASYNPFSHNVYRDAMIISIMDTLTSILAGVTIFAVLGNLAVTLDKDIKDVVGAGPALAFISYPEAISQFTFLPQLFSVLFFLMLFTLGVGSATSLTNAIITVIHDQFSHIDKRWITTAVCFLGFLSGLIYVTPGGQWMLDLVDTFGAGFVILFMATMEMIGFIWVYGLSNIIRDVEFMLNKRISIYWKFCWGIFIPLSLSIIFLANFITRIKKPITYEDKDYPLPAIVFGWIIAAIALLIPPVAAFHSIWTRKSESWSEKLAESLRPSKKWGPKDPKIRENWLHCTKAPTATEELVGLFRKIKKLFKRS